MILCYFNIFFTIALGLDDKVGNFEVGKEFDALLVNVCAEDSPFDVFQTETYQDSLKVRVIEGVHTEK